VSYREENDGGGEKMLICRLIGHQLNYDIKKPEWLALVCTRCGYVRTLCEVKIASPSPHCTPSAPPRSTPDRP